MRINRSPLRWVGGKGKLIHTILPLFPKHKGYVEVFGGSAVVLLNKSISKWEVYNDFDSNLVNFWRVIQYDKEGFLREFEYEVVSREQFNRYKEIYKQGTYRDEMEQAKIFYYLVRSGFGGDMRSPSFGTSKDKNRLRMDNMERDINSAYERIKGITIENKSFDSLIPTYDSKDTFFYLDPPYRKTKQYATGKFTDDQYQTLFDVLENVRGKWLMTINDDPYIRDLFKDYQVIDHDVLYTISKQGRNLHKELIITNYDSLAVGLKEDVLEIAR